MSNLDDANALVKQLQSLHDSLVQAWGEASNAGKYVQAKALNAQADRAGDQLIEARQYLLAVIDSGKDVSALVQQMAGLADQIKAQQTAVTQGTEDLNDVSGVLDTVGKLITTAQTLAGGAAQ